MSIQCLKVETVTQEYMIVALKLCINQRNYGGQETGRRPGGDISREGQWDRVGMKIKWLLTLFFVALQNLILSSYC